MKKYLMMGAAALVFGFAAVSCSSDDVVYNPNAKSDQIVANYKRAFVNVFGQPAANQTWGFGTAAKGRTRLGSYSSANTEHNQWAAVDNIYKLLVPPALTEGQIARVKAYFQANPYLTYEDPHMTKFFVQQVYKGNPETRGEFSAEQYREGNNTPVVGSAHMDKLTVGNGEQHVNDFNNGDCGESTVLNNGTKQNNYVPNGTTHQDKITLMMNATTECVGFFNSEGSVQHNDCCALAAASVIDAWAENEENYVEGEPIGEAVVDGWNRSFVGLDYEQKSIESLYVVKNGSAYAKGKDFMSKQMKYVLYQGRIVEASTISTILEGNLTDPAGNPVHWITDNTNQFLGYNLGTNQNTFNKQMSKSDFKTLYNIDITNGSEDYYDLDAVLYYVNQGALPKMNNMEFIKDLGGRDYVYSDWIVTLTPAKSFVIDNPTQPSLRVIGEDLTASDESDFDFNDVVFDVTRLTATTAQITLQAAGGTLPLRINKVVKTTVASDYVPTDADSWEVHNLFNVPVGVMVNTNADKKNLPSAKKDPVTEDLAKNALIVTADNFPEDQGEFAAAVKDIRVWVNKGTEEEPMWIELTAEQGEPACKVGVKKGFQWVDERTPLTSVYVHAKQWVQNASVVWY